MTSKKTSIRIVSRSITLMLALKILTVIAFFSPSFSDWIKRLFSTLIIYHELQRRNLFRTTTLFAINDSLLKISQTRVLVCASDIISHSSLRCDLDSCGLVQDYNQRINMEPSKAIQISEAIIDTIPKELHYNRELMVLDIQRIIYSH